jgi:hypothetical protein
LPTAVDLAWGAESDRLTVAPTAGWTPGTYVVVTVAGTARDRAGTPLGSPARAAFLSRSAATARFSAPDASDGRVPVHTTFVITVVGDVDADVVADAVRVEPEVEGRMAVTHEADPGRRPASDGPHRVHACAALPRHRVYRGWRRLRGRRGAAVLVPEARPCALPHRSSASARRAATGVRSTPGLDRFDQLMEQPHEAPSSSPRAGRR